MTRYDLLKMNTGVLNIFIANKIDMKDVNRLAMFEEYCDMRNRGEKYWYTIRHLADKYECSPECVKSVTRRMKKDVRLH